MAAGTTEKLAPRRSGKPRRQPRTRALSREVIVAAALRVIDDEGVDAVTMRRVAEELGTGAASLYAHVSDKEELLELAFDQVLADAIADVTPDRRHWQEQAKEMLRRWRATLLQHRDLARVGMGRVPVGPNALRGLESMLSVLRASRLPDQAIAYAADVLAGYVIAQAYEASIFSARDAELGAGAYEQEIQAYFESLPAGQFPTLVSMAAAMIGDENDADERFEFGIDVVIRGLAALARRPA